MKNNPVKLPPERLVEVLGIIPHTVDANIDFTYNRLTCFGHVEGDDVRVVIMLQVGLVDLQQRLVRTKDIVHCNKRLLFFAEKGRDKSLQPPPLFQGEACVRKMKADAGAGILVGRHFQKSQKSLGKRN